jgi:hypothetical protein
LRGRCAAGGFVPVWKLWPSQCWSRDPLGSVLRLWPERAVTWSRPHLPFTQTCSTCSGMLLPRIPVRRKSAPFGVGYSHRVQRWPYPSHYRAAFAFSRDPLPPGSLGLPHGWLGRVPLEKAKRRDPWGLPGSAITRCVRGRVLPVPRRACVLLMHAERTRASAREFALTAALGDRTLDEAL